MAYRWKAQIEAVQLPGDLPAAMTEEGAAEFPRKGSWLVFEGGTYAGCFGDKEFGARIQPARAHRASKPAPVEEKPKRGRPRGMKPLSVTDGLGLPIEIGLTGGG